MFRAILVVLIYVMIINCINSYDLKRYCAVCLTGLGLTLGSSQIVHAVTDCKKDCFKNCLIAAPGSRDYCTTSCDEYCQQDDRHDGLSGSIDAKNGETGIFGGSIDGTVVNDRPPILLNLIGKDTMRDLMINGNVKK